MSNMAHESLIPPLHMVICRAGDSQLTKGLAESVQNAFRGNISGEDAYIATISDLPVPIRSFSECPSGFLRSSFLDNALHTMVVFLVDEKMQADDKWVDWIQECERYVASSNGRHQLIALCTNDEIKKTFTLFDHQTGECYSVKVGYNDLQKNKEYAFGEYAERPTWFALYVLQACRHLLARTVFQSSTDKEKLKLKLFISHAKKDSLPLANSLRSALNQKDYFSTWYDAVDLDGVVDWRQAINDGVNNSVVIVLRTEKYDTRPWCRQEFIWADQCAVPIVCVEARNSLEYAADILAASRVPTVRIPDGNLFRVLFLALKESLRIMQLERKLIQLSKSHIGVKKAKTRFLIPYTPDLKNLTHARNVIADKRGRSRSGYNFILYADPPLTPELYQASKRYVSDQCGMTYMFSPALLPFWVVTASSAQSTPNTLSTPSMLYKQVNIAISEHDRDLKRLGLSVHEMNSFTVQMAQALIANEATVAFGHDWRDDGVMQEIYQFAEENQDVVLSEDKRNGLIKNYCFWGTRPGLNERERGHLRGILDIIECDRPDDARLGDYELLSEVPGELWGYSFARALSAMRREMTKNTFARVCLGGRDMDPAQPGKGPLGRCPGVVEEALMSCLAGKPLYLSALLGGVTEQVIRAIQGKGETASLDFVLPEMVAVAYAGAEIGGKPDLAARPTKSQLQKIYHYDGHLTSEEILTIFGDYGLERLAANNGLSEQENLRLFNAGTIDEVIGWVLTGLARLRVREVSGVGE